mmetsp:Transcript_38564/g.110752  ORF Transcript_38564/g.110752 Transcript_38564/m.110752 type:complete len:241 (+) Transcript_38564:157-879(+)
MPTCLPRLCTSASSACACSCTASSYCATNALSATSRRRTARHCGAHRASKLSCHGPTKDVVWQSSSNCRHVDNRKPSAAKGFLEPSTVTTAENSSGRSMYSIRITRPTSSLFGHNGLLESPFCLCALTNSDTHPRNFAILVSRRLRERPKPPILVMMCCAMSACASPMSPWKRAKLSGSSPGLNSNLMSSQLLRLREKRLLRSRAATIDLENAAGMRLCLRAGAWSPPNVASKLSPDAAV